MTMDRHTLERKGAVIAAAKTGTEITDEIIELANKVLARLAYEAAHWPDWHQVCDESLNPEWAAATKNVVTDKFKAFAWPNVLGGIKKGLAVIREDYGFGGFEHLQVAISLLKQTGRLVQGGTGRGRCLIVLTDEPLDPREILPAEDLPAAWAPTATATAGALGMHTHTITPGQITHTGEGLTVVAHDGAYLVAAHAHPQEYVDYEPEPEDFDDYEDDEDDDPLDVEDVPDDTEFHEQIMNDLFGQDGPMPTIPTVIEAPLPPETWNVMTTNVAAAPEEVLTADAMTAATEIIKELTGWPFAPAEPVVEDVPMANKDIDPVGAIEDLRAWCLGAVQDLIEANKKTEDAVAKAVKEAVEKERATAKTDPAEAKALKARISELEQTVAALERALAERSVSSWM
jgi:hypothetical protein